MIDTLSSITFEEVLKLLGWVSSFTMALVAAILTPILKKRWKEEAKSEATVTLTGQPIQIQNTPGPVTFNDLLPITERISRIETDVKELREGQAVQFVQILESGAERENRLRDKLDAIARELHHRLDLQFGPKPRASR
jgi:hypothetical protein